MEVGVNPVAAWYAQREGRSLINFGATSGDIPARIAVMHDSGTLLPRDKAVERAATPEEFREILDRVAAAWTKAHSVSASASPTCPMNRARKSSALPAGRRAQGPALRPHAQRRTGGARRHRRPAGE